MIAIAASDLAPETLRAIIESFIVREGTDYGEAEYSLDNKVEQVRGQLDRGDVLLMWDEQLESCNLITKAQWRRYLAETSLAESSLAESGE
ncbi:MAG: YheU family protein [Gammaproteobacteria bacterium]|nr:YheU family protein [Gammaproteobacteria bacterium]MBQ0840983.1 YheU family protein [Gammaproteobacteria bacterium]